MKVVLLAGGLGTRISEESHLRPKPMIEIGEKPILWHIMKYYSTFGFKDFIICAGYKQYMIKEYFADYFLHNSDVTFDLARRYVGDESFMLTYGDGLCNVDLDKLLKFHNESGCVGTLTMVNIAELKGVLEVSDKGVITSFREKEDCDASLINGGFMVFNKEIFDYLESDETVLEKEPLGRLASEGKLAGFYHDGFWQCMDTQREKEKLEKLWASGSAPWKVW